VRTEGGARGLHKKEKQVFGNVRLLPTSEREIGGQRVLARGGEQERAEKEKEASGK